MKKMGMKILWIFLGFQLLGSFSMYFRVFFKLDVQNGDIFLGCNFFNYFWGCLIFLLYFFFRGGGEVNSKCWPKSTFQEKMRVPPPPPPGSRPLQRQENQTQISFYNPLHKQLQEQLLTQ